MRFLESECPNAFILTSESQMPFNPKNLISQKYKLYLLCQYPSGPHRISDDKGYEVRKPHGWWVKISPWLKHLATFVKYGFPIAGISMAAFDHKDFQTLNNEIDLLSKLHEELSEIVDSDASQDQEFRTQDELEGSALRVLYNFLKEVDPLEQWAGLEKIITPDGNILWLCHEHAQFYQTKPLQLDSRT